jgi:hypothetical protein
MGALFLMSEVTLYRPIDLGEERSSGLPTLKPNQTETVVQGYLAHIKKNLLRTLQQAHA